MLLGNGSLKNLNLGLCRKFVYSFMMLNVLGTMDAKNIDPERKKILCLIGHNFFYLNSK
jgi:hypothetical protein